MVVSIITGSNGQDGIYLNKLLQSKGYDVKLYDGDILDINSFHKTLECYKNYVGIIEIYNLAAKVDVLQEHAYSESLQHFEKIKLKLIGN